jgi:hypothetical protein
LFSPYFVLPRSIDRRRINVIGMLIEDPTEPDAVVRFWAAAFLKLPSRLAVFIYFEVSSGILTCFSESA